MPIYKGELVSQSRLALLQSMERVQPGVESAEKSTAPAANVPMRWDNTLGKAVPLADYLSAKKSSKAAALAEKEAEKEAAREAREAEKTARRAREAEKAKRKVEDAKRARAIARLRRVLQLNSQGHIALASRNFRVRREWEAFVASICVGRKLHSAGREWEGGHEAPQWPSPIAAAGAFARLAAMDAACDHTGQGIPVWVEYKDKGSVRLHKAVSGTYNLAATKGELDFAHVAA